MMRGFTGDFYNGVPVFIRSEYEEAHQGMSEIERLNEYLGLNSDNPVTLFTYIEQNDISLLYGQKDLRTDMLLRDCEDWQLMWKPYESGWVHKITGEYVKGNFPNRDSYPFWCLYALRSNFESEETSCCFTGLTEIATGLAVIMALSRLSEEEDDYYEEDDDEYYEDDNDGIF